MCFLQQLFCFIKIALNYIFLFCTQINWIKLFVGSTYFLACSLQNRFPEIYDIKEHMDVTAEAICSIMTKVEMAKDIHLHMWNVFAISSGKCFATWIRQMQSKPNCSLQTGWFIGYKFIKQFYKFIKQFWLNLPHSNGKYFPDQMVFLFNIWKWRSFVISTFAIIGEIGSAVLYVA